MGQRDLYQSDFYEDKNRFADIFNGALFKGKEVMKLDLETADSAKTILGMLKVNINLKEIMIIDDSGKAVYDMCKAFEEYREEGRKESWRVVHGPTEYKKPNEKAKLIF